MAPRIGTFFILVGFFMAVIFLATEAYGQPDFDYFFGAAFLLIAGMLMRRRRGARSETARFRFVRSLRERQKKKDKDAAAGKK